MIATTGLQKISSPLTEIFRYLPLVITPVAWVVAGALYPTTIDAEQALAIGGATTLFAGFIFFVYSAWLWNVSMTEDGVLICTRFSKRLEVAQTHVRRIELFPDVLFRGHYPQYILIFHEPQSGQKSIRFYPTPEGKRRMENMMALKRKASSRRR